MPFLTSALISWLNKKVVDPFLQIVHKGAEPEQLAFSTALGFTLGLFPICGVTVFLCAFAIAILRHRCHAPSVMLANFVATPIELSLVIPFLRLGELITGGPRLALTSDALKKVVTGQASRKVLVAILHALLGWIVAWPIMLVTLYMFLTPCFKYLVKNFIPVHPSSPMKLGHLPPAEVLAKVRDV